MGLSRFRRGIEGHKITGKGKPPYGSTNNEMTTIRLSCSIPQFCLVWHLAVRRLLRLEVNPHGRGRGVPCYQNFTSMGFLHPQNAGGGGEQTLTR